MKRHYNATKSQSDLNRAIKLLKEALESHPAQHRRFAAIIEQLTEIILLSNSSPQDAFETFKKLKTCGPAVSLDLWDATQAWVKNAEKYNHPSALEAYQTTLNTLDHFTSMQSSLDSRHETMQARVADLANNAFSCAMRYNDLSMGVELLEQGQGILWNQLTCFDISIVALESRGKKGCELGNKFRQLSGELRKHAGGSGGQGMDPYWWIQEEWQSVVDRIRHLGGFSRFLLPPLFNDLQ